MQKVTDLRNMRQRNRGPRRGNHTIRQVWASNFATEISRFDRCLRSYTILSIDTEFPGSIRKTPWGSIDEQLYEDFRFNVNQTKVLQLGVTAFNESGRIGGTWEFNFSDFDPEIDAQNPASIAFLKQNGLDFEKLKNEGISLDVFAASFTHILRKNWIFRWVTFHGLYDIGYLMKAMGIIEHLPESMAAFARMVVREVGIVRDLKHMARFCEGLEEGKLGLERMGQLLEQKRFGLQHHAGSDSQLTAMLHTTMFEWFDLDSKTCDGFLYGFSNNLEHICMDMKVRAFQKIRSIPIPYVMPAMPVYHNVTFVQPIPYLSPVPFCF